MSSLWRLWKGKGEMRLEKVKRIQFIKYNIGLFIQ